MDVREDRYEVRSDYIITQNYSGNAWYIWDNILNKQVGAYEIHFLLDDDDVKALNEHWKKEIDEAKREQGACFFSYFHNLPNYLTGFYLDIPYGSSNAYKVERELKEELKKIDVIQNKRKHKFCELYLSVDRHILKDVEEYNKLVREENLSREKLKLPLMKEINYIKELPDAFKELSFSLERDWLSKGISSWERFTNE